MSPVADQERTERLAEQHRREIVDAAERLVKGNGLHQLKLRDIAKESGKSLGNLYNYFQNKEAIIEALVEREKSRFLMVVSQTCKSSKDHSKPRNEVDTSLKSPV